MTYFFILPIRSIRNIYNIYTKYREANKANKEKIVNNESLFHIKDNDNNELTETINYKIEGIDEEFKFIIIGTNEMLNNV